MNIPSEYSHSFSGSIKIALVHPLIYGTLKSNCNRLIRTDFTACVCVCVACPVRLVHVMEEHANASACTAPIKMAFPYARVQI